MSEWLSIRSLSEEETLRLEEDIRLRIAEKKARGLLTDRDVEEMVDMRLKPLADIQDVQSVYENTLFSRRNNAAALRAGRSSARSGLRFSSSGGATRSSSRARPSRSGPRAARIAGLVQQEIQRFAELGEAVEEEPAVAAAALAAQDLALAR